MDYEPAIYVTAPVSELLTYLGVESIRLRRNSGIQYRAMCQRKTDDESHRINYGLIITTGEPAIYETIPQRERSHKSSKIKAQLNIPWFTLRSICRALRRKHYELLYLIINYI